MRLYTCLLIFLLGGASSCEDIPEVDQSFILSTDEQNDNSEDIESIVNDLVQVKSLIGNLKGNDHYPDLALLLVQIKSEDSYSRVVLKDEIGKIFDPKRNFCDLPRRVKNKLNKLKDKGKQWAPEYVVGYLSQLPDTVLFVPRTSISALLHTVNIKTTTGHSRSQPVFDAPTFETFDFDRFVIKKGFSSFFYSLDCSGFLSAAIEGSGAVPGADIQGSAKSALEGQKSMFIAGGVIVSPIAAAYHGNNFGTDLDTTERIAILEKVLQVPDVTDLDTIVCKVSYDAIWSSDEGISSFNGKANLGGSSKASIGIARISANGKTDATITRSSSFSNYKTYFVRKKDVQGLKPFTFQQVKEKLQELKQL